MPVKVAVAEKAPARMSKAASTEDEEGSTSRRRSNRQPDHTQMAQEAANSKTSLLRGICTARDNPRWCQVAWRRKFPSSPSFVPR